MNRKAHQARHIRERESEYLASLSSVMGSGTHVCASGTNGETELESPDWSSFRKHVKTGNGTVQSSNAGQRPEESELGGNDKNAVPAVTGANWPITAAVNVRLRGTWLTRQPASRIEGTTCRWEPHCGLHLATPFFFDHTLTISVRELKQESPGTPKSANSSATANNLVLSFIVNEVYPYPYI